MDYKDKIKEILKDKTIPEEQKKKLEEILFIAEISEYERIRKELITHCRNTRCVTEGGAERIAKWIAWLEKQVVQKSNMYDAPKISIKDAVEVTSRMKYIPNDMKSIADFIIDYAHWDLQKSEWNQPTITVPLFRVLDALIQNGKPYCVGNSALEAIKEEKVDDANKVDHKFKVGDWIIRSAEGFKHNTYLVKEVKDYYVCEELKGRRVTFTFNDVHKNFKLWDISDAKDGDVLYLQHDGKEHIIIYKGVIKERFKTFVSAYCAYNGIVDAFCFADVSRYADIAYGSIMPATKEQRDLLFQKMHEAGYMWDSDSKQLLSLKAEPNNEKKLAWSEEDENNLTDTCVAIRKFYHRNNGAQELVDWLQSLKERETWKPSDKQIRALRWVLNNIPYNKHKEEISGLLDQIKDL